MDSSQSAFAVLKTSMERLDKPRKNPAAVALGKLGGRKGGKARAAALTPERRREIARMGGKAGGRGRK